MIAAPVPPSAATGRADPPGPTGRWRNEIRAHPIWTRTAEGAADPEVVEFVGGLAHLAAARERQAAGDPWWDAELPERVGRRAGFLARTVFAESPDDRPTRLEAGLLAAFPFVHRVFRLYWIAACRAVPDDRGDPEGVAPQPQPEGETGTFAAREFRNFARTFPRLYRRAWDETTSAPKDEPAAEAIRWWIFHRWLARQPGIYEPRQVARALDLDPAGTILGLPAAPVVAQLAGLLRLHRYGADQATDFDAGHPVGVIWPIAEGESEVRVRLIGLILTLADRMALDPAGMPEVVPDHVGTSDPIDPASVLATVRAATWRAGGGGARVLVAECRHPALESALHDRVREADELVRGCHRAAAPDGRPEGPLRLLSRLPAQLSAESVSAGDLADGPAYDEGGYFQFRLADERVRELLMGTSLYGDPALAIRELYQNALDACRYRDARLRCLRAKGETPPPWRGTIHFEQGIGDDGRPYLDCADNGIGMGRNEIVNSFARAGVRFTDLPGYLEEQYEWARYGIVVYPNSRFGIGVLSYFMLADELIVTTRRMNADGRVDDPLEVSIGGPDSLARIRRRPAKPWDWEPGTRIRLILRRDRLDVSCTDLLRRVLWISESDVTARHGSDVLQWTAGELASSAPVGAVDVFAAGPLPSGPPELLGGAGVWWCPTMGALLADGVWAGRSRYGAVVNLTGPHVPRLSVDRRVMTIDPVDEHTIDGLLRDRIPELVARGFRTGTLPWLGIVAEHDPRLADLIGAAVIADPEIRWTVGETVVPMSRIGCFPADELLVRALTHWRHRNATFLGPTARLRQALADPWIEWRFAAWVAAGLVPGFRWTAATGPPPALPTDHTLTAPPARTESAEEPPPVADLLLRARGLGRPAGELADRLAVLGHPAPPADWRALDALPPRHLDRLLAILHADADENQSWLDPGDPVAAGHVVAAACRFGHGCDEIARWLRCAGYLVAERVWPPIAERAELDMRVALTAGIRDTRAWTDPAQPVPPGLVIGAAAQLDTTCAAIADHLRRSGFRVEPRRWPEIALPRERFDRGLIRFRFGAQTAWNDPDAEVPRGRVVLAAVGLGRGCGEVAEALGLLGYRVPPGPWPHPQAADGPLISRYRDARAPWLDPGLPLPAAQVVAVAAAAPQRTSCRRIADRCAALGFEVREPAGGWPDLDDVDRRMLDFLSDALHDIGGPDRLVGVPRVFAIATAVHISPAEVADRLIRLGLRVDPLRWRTLDTAMVGIRNPDLLLFGFNPRSADPFDDLDVPLGGGIADSAWLLHHRPVPAVKVVLAAAALHRSPADVADRLRSAGVRITAPAGWPVLTDADRVLLSAEADGEFPFHDVDAEIPAGQVIAAAVVTGRPARAVAARLAELGVVVPQHDWSGVGGGTDRPARDLILLGKRSDGATHWPDPRRPLPALAVLTAAERLTLPPPEVARRLARLGCRLPDGVEVIPDE